MMLSQFVFDPEIYTRAIATIVNAGGSKVITRAAYIHVDDLGHALTARHILAICYEIRSRLYDHRYSGEEVVVEDEPNDLGLLKIKN